MQPLQYHHQNSRINHAELKAQIVNKLGPQESHKYFYYLNQFLSLKLTKIEFNKLCLRIIGRDNIYLHNQLIRSVLRNASNSILTNGFHSIRKNRTARFPCPNGKTCHAVQTSDFITSLETISASSRSPIRAPLGIRFCRDVLPIITKPSSLDGVLLDSLTLRERMEKIATIQGLEGVSMDSTILLNCSLDSYMKGLIRICVELAGARSGHDIIKNCTKLVSSIRPGHQFQTGCLDVLENHCPVSFRDFKVAMELNPRKLGFDWPLFLEKICNTFEE